MFMNSEIYAVFFLNIIFSNTLHDNTVLEHIDFEIYDVEVFPQKHSIVIHRLFQK